MNFNKTLLKKRLWHRCFPVNFAKLLKHLFSRNTSGGCFSLVLITLQEHFLQNIFSSNISFWMVVLLSTIFFCCCCCCELDSQSFNISNFISSCFQGFNNKIVLKNYTNFARKQLCWSLFS